jgi:hypothetical protein
MNVENLPLLVILVFFAVATLFIMFCMTYELIMDKLIEIKKISLHKERRKS